MSVITKDSAVFVLEFEAGESFIFMVSEVSMWEHHMGPVPNYSMFENSSSQ